MVMRKIVLIDEDRCNGCGQCVPNCHEGALQIIDGKARLISDLFCDGLGACIGHCPQEAITIVERVAEPYDERKVMGMNIVPNGVNVIRAHMEHLREHDAKEYLDSAIEYLREKGIGNPLSDVDVSKSMNVRCNCPGSEERVFDAVLGGDDSGKRMSQLRQWPVQLHLVSPSAPYFKGRDMLLAADCTAYALGDFHKDYLSGKSLAIFCPKLDSGQEIYLSKLVSLIDDAKIKSLTVMIMEVPCCRGMFNLVEAAIKKSVRKIDVRLVVVGIRGDIISDDIVK
ncbi:MAG: 4Fe-4S binding protein [Candidatus Aenigmarchaeota archaeon]|nr:4Fe-4S binding protein [Candidatus Aenigmarchaeota archaeon]